MKIHHRRLHQRNDGLFLALEGNNLALADRERPPGFHDLASSTKPVALRRSEQVDLELHR